MASIAPVTDLRARLLALSPRERKLLAVGAVAVALFLVYLLLRGGGEEEPVELTTAPPAAVPATPPPPPAYVSPPATPVQATAPAPSASDLLLIGIFGGGPGGGAAIVQMADGGQRTIRMGREFQPGLALKSVGLNHVVIGGAGGDLRLELGKAGGTAIANSPAPATASSAPAATATPASQQRETMQYRLGMEPVNVGGTSGFRIKPGAKLPHLDRAGLQPGDVIVGVNGGNGFTEERLMEMSWEIANSGRTEFDVIRANRRIKLAVER